MIDTLRQLWILKRRYGLSWAKALEEGVQGLQRYADLDRRYEAERDAKTLVDEALSGPGGHGQPPAADEMEVHDFQHQY